MLFPGGKAKLLERLPDAFPERSRSEASAGKTWICCSRCDGQEATPHFGVLLTFFCATRCSIYCTLSAELLRIWRVQAGIRRARQAEVFAAGAMQTQLTASICSLMLV